LRAKNLFSWGENRLSNPKKSFTSAENIFSGRSIFFSRREKKLLRLKTLFLARYNLFSAGKNRFKRA
jgi:hypothetical protein